MNDPAARCAGSSYSISKVLKTSGGPNNEQISLLGPAKLGESDPSERPEARSPIIRKNWNQNEQASGRPIEPLRLTFVSLYLSIYCTRLNAEPKKTPNCDTFPYKTEEIHQKIACFD
jgi:hypothetical protein